MLKAPKKSARTRDEHLRGFLLGIMVAHIGAGVNLGEIDGGKQLGGLSDLETLVRGVFSGLFAASFNRYYVDTISDVTQGKEARLRGPPQRRSYRQLQRCIRLRAVLADVLARYERLCTAPLVEVCVD